MKKHFKLPLLFAFCVSAQTLAAADQLSFPGAYGWGRYATGGRFGQVYHVTNLNDSGAGSFRDAVSQPNRIVVFDVAGVINISSRITFAKNLYVAGQTAPGEGVTLYGDGVSFSGANNLICRYLRVRMGHGGSSGKDCAGVANGTNMIFDHCSFAWGLDETFSINSDGKGDLGNITIQNCIIGQGLMPHSAGGLIQADNITLYRNFYCDNSTRNNKVKGRNQYANNIVYNWNNAAYIMGGDSEGQSYANIQSNLFINGPSGGGDAFTGGNGNFHFYASDNWQDSNKDGVYSPYAVTSYSASDKQASAYAYPELPLYKGNELIEKNLPTVGASLPYRDMTDCYMVDELLSYGKRGELIANEGTLPYGIPSTWKVYKGAKRVDTDGDGMPDWWEQANGTDPQKNDAMVIAANGYANIENYINSITAEQSDFFLRAPMSLNVTNSSTSTLTVAWADYTHAEDGFAVEVKGADGTWQQVAITASGATTYRLTNLQPGTGYDIRVRAFARRDDGDKYSDYSNVVTAKTRPVEVGIIDIDSYVPDYTWMPGITAWGENTTGWKEGIVWMNDGSKAVLFDMAEDADVQITDAVSPASVVVEGDGHLTLTGVIDGENTSVNKTGSGTLTLNGANTYKGATVLHEGTLEFATLKNGGVASGIGASQEFAQNWVMDGGTYRYTGTSTSTNRSARMMRSTTLEVANKATVVSMNGSIEGTGDFTIGGAGKIQVAGTDFFKYNGQTVLKGGELFLSTIEASKNGLGQSRGLVLAGGKLSTKGENEAYETYDFPIYAQPGTYSYLAPHRNCYMNNTLTGSGTVEIIIPYVREYVKGNWSAFTGRIVANGNLFLANSNFNLPQAVVELKNGSRACNWATEGNATLGGLCGGTGTYLSGASKQTNGFKCTWHIGSANTDEVFQGIINDWSVSGSGHLGTVSIEKTGTGYWRLTGNNEYSGTTTVTAGTLIVNGAHTGTGAITVANGATLAGKGTLKGNVTIRKGGCIQAGDSIINSNNLTLEGTTTLQSGAVMSVPVKVGTTTYITNRLKATKVVLNSGAILQLELPEDVTEMIVDKSVTVFASGTTVTGSFASITPDRPSATTIWDTTELYTKGRLYVREDPTAVGSMQAPAKDAPRYALDGRRVQTPQQGQVYIMDGKKYLK